MTHPDIVQRLQEPMARSWTAVAGADGRMRHPLMLEAATEITALRQQLAEIERICTECERINLVGKSVKAKIAGTLRHVLRVIRSEPGGNHG